MLVYFLVRLSVIFISQVVLLFWYLTLFVLFACFCASPPWYVFFQSEFLLTFIMVMVIAIQAIVPDTTNLKGKF